MIREHIEFVLPDRHKDLRGDIGWISRTELADRVASVPATLARAGFWGGGPYRSCRLRPLSLMRVRTNPGAGRLAISAECLLVAEQTLHFSSG